MTQLLARKEYQILFVNKEKEFYRRAFTDTREQNNQIRKELSQFQEQLSYQLSDNHILTNLQKEMQS